MFFGCIVEEFLVYIFFTEESSKTCKKQGTGEDGKVTMKRKRKKEGGGAKKLRKHGRYQHMYIHLFLFSNPRYSPPPPPHTLTYPPPSADSGKIHRKVSSTGRLVNVVSDTIYTR